MGEKHRHSNEFLIQETKLLVSEASQIIVALLMIFMRGGLLVTIYNNIVVTVHD